MTTAAAATPPAMAWTHLSGCPCCAAVPRLSGNDAATLCSLTLPPLVDSHNHIHIGDTSEAVLYVAQSTRSAVLAVAEECWPRVLAYCSDGGGPSNARVAGLGIHPWRAHDVSDGWQARLSALLAANPRAVVGEIGLCKCAKNLRGPGMKQRNWPVQVDVFAEQLRIAARLRRPTSVHCVKACGTLIDVLAACDASELPTAIALHSFSGSANEVHRLLKLAAADKIYFGFSHTVNVAMGGGVGSKGHEVLLEAIRAVPEQRLLIESDVDDPGRAPHATLLAAELVAAARGWDVAHTAAVTSCNAAAWLASVLPGVQGESAAVRAPAAGSESGGAAVCVPIYQPSSSISPPPSRVSSVAHAEPSASRSERQCFLSAPLPTPSPPALAFRLVATSSRTCAATLWWL